MLTAGPLDPWQAARVIAEAADGLAVAHEAGLAHLCLTPACLWCGTGGEVTITGLGIVAALTGAHAADLAQADTRGLARLLYAALTGYWPGEGPAALPPAPCPGGRIARPGQVRPGIPAALDSVTCRALGGQAPEGGPPILSPAQLAMELAAVTRPDEGPSPELSSSAAPAPTLPDRAAWLPPPTARAVRRRTRLTAVIVILAVLAGGGWLAVREMTASNRPSGAHPAAAAQILTAVSATAFGPLGESDGDNPELARLAIDGSTATAWHTQWYATAAFGNLKPGTGLLLDMGRPVTITSAQIMLGAMTGTNFQLRAGGEPVLADLQPVASTTAAGGLVTTRPTRPGQGPLPAPLVHPAAAGLLRHVPGNRLRRAAARHRVRQIVIASAGRGCRTSAPGAAPPHPSSGRSRAEAARPGPSSRRSGRGLRCRACSHPPGRCSPP